MDDQPFSPPTPAPTPPEETPPPEPVTPSQPAYSTYSAPKRVSTKSLLFVLLAIILIAVGAAGGYEYGHKSQKTITTQKAIVQSVNSTPNLDQNVHFVQSIGYPYDKTASKYQFLTKLGVPSFMQAVRITSTNQNRGAEQIFTNLYNNELGRWDLGNPNDPSENGGGTSEISLLAITQSWLSATGTTDFTDYGYGSALETPTQKAQFMSQLESSTSACVQNAIKGFKTKDGNLNVCFTYSYGKEAYGPEISLSGYGDIQGQPVILVGLIVLHDDSVGASQTAQLQAVGNANSGHPPVQTVQDQKAVINALQQTTVTTSPNPNL